MGDLCRTRTQKNQENHLMNLWFEWKQIHFSDAKVDISFQSFQSYHSTQLRSSFTALSSLQPRKDLTVNTSYGAAKPSQTCRTQRMRRPWEVECIKLPSVSCKKVTHQVLLSHMWRLCVLNDAFWSLLSPCAAILKIKYVSQDNVVSLSHLPEIRCPSIFKVWLWLSPWILISMQALKNSEVRERWSWGQSTMAMAANGRIQEGFSYDFSAVFLLCSGRCFFFNVIGF